MDERRKKIFDLLTQHGSMGVNDLAAKLGVAVSTLHTYLTKQSYFEKTADRKWTLPTNAGTLATGGNELDFATIIESQRVGISASLQLLGSQLDALFNFQNAYQVARIGPSENITEFNIDSRLRELLEREKAIVDLIKKYKKITPVQYIEPLANLDIIGLVLAKGIDFMNKDFMVHLTDLFLEKKMGLPPEIIALMDEFQLGKEKEYE